MIHLLQKPLLGVPVNWSHPLARGLVCCWLMNEGGGNKIYDLSGNGNTGSFYGDTKWTPGKFGSALSFDGTEDYVNVSDSNSLDIGTTNNLTISLWVKVNSFAVAGGLVSKATGTGSTALDYRISILTESRFSFYVGAYTYINSYITRNTNQWYHVVGVWRGSFPIDIYVNGIKDNGTSNGSTKNAANTGSLYIGSTYTSSSSFNGTIDDVMIFNRALTASEIAQLYREPFAMFDTYPVWWFYIFGEGAGGQMIFGGQRILDGGVVR